MWIVIKFAAVLQILFIGLLAGCSDSVNTGGGSAAPTIATITLLPPSTTLAVGERQTFSTQATDQNGAVMTGISFTWVSSNRGAAAVSDGEVGRSGVGAKM
jgi:uncharacterized protein YjdB